MILNAIILGIIQGLTEFLPISSSGHLLLAGKILDDTPGLAYELALHLATLAAVIIVYRKDVFGLIRHPLSKLSKLVVTASVPTVIIVMLGGKLFKSAFDGRYLGICFLITGVILLVSGMVKYKKTKPIGYLDAVIIGVTQGFAAFPGISRSGSTICAATLLGKDKEESAKFSFLLSIPIILGSSIVEFGSGSGGAFMTLPTILAGFFAAFFTGLFALKWMIRLVVKKSLDGFAVYLIILSVFVLVNDFFLNLF